MDFSNDAYNYISNVAVSLAFGAGYYIFNKFNNHQKQFDIDRKSKLNSSISSTIYFKDLDHFKSHIKEIIKKLNTNSLLMHEVSEISSLCLLDSANKSSIVIDTESINGLLMISKLTNEIREFEILKNEIILVDSVTSYSIKPDIETILILCEDIVKSKKEFESIHKFIEINEMKSDELSKRCIKSTIYHNLLEETILHYLIITHIDIKCLKKVTSALNSNLKSSINVNISSSMKDRFLTKIVDDFVFLLSSDTNSNNNVEYKKIQYNIALIDEHFSEKVNEKVKVKDKLFEFNDKVYFITKTNFPLIKWILFNSYNLVENSSKLIYFNEFIYNCNNPIRFKLEVINEALLRYENNETYFLFGVKKVESIFTISLHLVLECEDKDILNIEDCFNQICDNMLKIYYITDFRKKYVDFWYRKSLQFKLQTNYNIKYNSDLYDNILKFSKDFSTDDQKIVYEQLLNELEKHIDSKIIEQKSFIEVTNHIYSNLFEFQYNLDEIIFKIYSLTIQFITMNNVDNINNNCNFNSNANSKVQIIKIQSITELIENLSITNKKFNENSNSNSNVNILLQNFNKFLFKYISINFQSNKKLTDNDYTNLFFIALDSNYNEEILSLYQSNKEILKKYTNDNAKFLSVLLESNETKFLEYIMQLNQEEKENLTSDTIQCLFFTIYIFAKKKNYSSDLIAIIVELVKISIHRKIFIDKIIDLFEILVDIKCFYSELNKSIDVKDIITKLLLFSIQTQNKEVMESHLLKPLLLITGINNDNHGHKGNKINKNFDNNEKEIDFSQDIFSVKTFNSDHINEPITPIILKDSFVKKEQIKKSIYDLESENLNRGKIKKETKKENNNEVKEKGLIDLYPNKNLVAIPSKTYTKTNFNASTYLKENKFDETSINHINNHNHNHGHHNLNQNSKTFSKFLNFSKITNKHCASDNNQSNINHISSNFNNSGL